MLAGLRVRSVLLCVRVLRECVSEGALSQACSRVPVRYICCAGMPGLCMSLVLLVGVLLEYEL